MKTKNQMITCVAVCALLLCGGLVFLKSRPNQNGTLINANVEVLSQPEQPNTLFCIYSPDWVCIGLHPFDPSQDDERPNAMWL